MREGPIRSLNDPRHCRVCHVAFATLAMAQKHRRRYHPSQVPRSATDPRPAPVPLAHPLIFTLPLPPPVTNAGHAHWARYEQRKKALWLRCDLATVDQHAPAAPYTAAVLTIVLRTVNQMDVTNAEARVKLLEDWLVQRGWLADDSPLHVTRLPVVQERVRRGTPGSVTLTLSPRAAEDPC